MSRGGLVMFCLLTSAFLSALSCCSRLHSGNSPQSQRPGVRHRHSDGGFFWRALLQARAASPSRLRLLWVLSFLTSLQASALGLVLRLRSGLCVWTCWVRVLSSGHVPEPLLLPLASEGSWRRVEPALRGGDARQEVAGHHQEHPRHPHHGRGRTRRLLDSHPVVCPRKKSDWILLSGLDPILEVGCWKTTNRFWNLSIQSWF